ncbi:Reverse transcriptase (RNA-dependent DNA polymerase) domain-containing protein [Ceratobasidium theobromae]|uniref:Reverse transcriptase (RNA-dependent DNA polymerase) domain-containing protein n=1 Tax=Ceratobasidium theobromae TaxID=1582974 RepID=A0A5N5QEN2_9AGAM|nr:Reverse transcriptase (RNA-dependent DNA polymerase) domain-containing protein [Ceratobasidium theobromae]
MAPSRPKPRCDQCVARGRHSKCDRKAPCGACVRLDSADLCSLGTADRALPPPLPQRAQNTEGVHGIRPPIARTTPSNPSIHTSSSPLSPPPVSPPASPGMFPHRPIPAPAFGRSVSPILDKDHEILRLQAEVAALRPRPFLDHPQQLNAPLPTPPSHPQPTRRQPIPGKVAEAVRFQIPQPAIDVMKDGWRRHIPLTMLTDRFCASYSHAPPRDLLQFDRSNRTLVPRASDLSDIGEDRLSVPEWIEAWKRLISLIESYQPTLVQPWLRHYHIVFMDTNFSTLFHIWLAYDIQVRRRAIDEDLDPATFQSNIFECVKLATQSDTRDRHPRSYVPGSPARRRSRSPPSTRTSYMPYSRPMRLSSMPDRARSPPPRSDPLRVDSKSRSRKRAKCLRCGSTDHQPRHCLADRRANDPSVTPSTAQKAAPTGIVNMAPTFAPSVATQAMMPSRARTDPRKIVTPLHADAWRTVLTNLDLIPSFSDIPTGLSQGFHLGANPPPHTPFTPPNHSSARDFPEAVLNHIRSELDAGRYSGPFDKDTLVSLIGSFRSSPLGVVPKSVPGESTPRYSPACGAFFDDIAEIVLVSPPGTTAATLDVDAAYRRMPIHPDDQPNLVVAWDNEFYVDHCAPFGAASSNGIFGRCGDAMQMILSISLGLSVRKWVDDFIIFRPPPDLPGGSTSIEDIYSIAAPLGWPWKSSKTCPFADTFTFLGFRWSIPDRTVDIPLAKRQKYVARLHAWVDAGRSTLADTQQLTGTLIHCTHVIPDGRAWLAGLFRFCATFPHAFHKRFIVHTIPQYARDDANWWLHRLRSECQLYLRSLPPSFPTPFYMDASTSFGIAVTSPTNWMAWRLLHPWHADGRDIGWAEMAAVAMALEVAISCGIRDATVTFRSDNQGVVFALEAGRSRNPPQNELLKYITKRAEDVNIRLHTTYIASAANPADPPSRGIRPHSTLSPFPGLITIPTILAPFVAHAHLLPPPNLTPRAPPPTNRLPNHASRAPTHYPLPYHFLPNASTTITQSHTTRLATMHNRVVIQNLFLEAHSSYLQSKPNTPPSPPTITTPSLPPPPRVPPPRHTQSRPSPYTLPSTPSRLIPPPSNPDIPLSPAANTGLSKALQHGLAHNTQVNYTSAITRFTNFCERENIAPPLRFPASEFVLCAFVGSFTDSQSGHSAANAIAALKSWHLLNGQPWNGGHLLAHVLRGSNILTPLAARRLPRPPVTTTMLSDLRSGLSAQDPLDTAVLAAALTAFWGQCRLGELLGSSRLKHNPASFPSRTSFNITAQPNSAAELTLPRTKTNQARGQTIFLTSQRQGLSPIKAIVNHLATNSSIPSSHHLFSSRDATRYGPPMATPELPATVFASEALMHTYPLGSPMMLSRCLAAGPLTHFLNTGVASTTLRTSMQETSNLPYSIPFFPDRHPSTSRRLTSCSTLASPGCRAVLVACPGLPLPGVLPCLPASLSSLNSLGPGAPPLPTHRPLLRLAPARSGG